MGSFFRLWVRFGFGIGCGPGLLRVGRTMAPPLRGLPGSLPFGAPAHPFPLPLPGSPLLPLLRAALNPPVRPPRLAHPQGAFSGGVGWEAGPDACALCWRLLVEPPTSKPPGHGEGDRPLHAPELLDNPEPSTPPVVVRVAQGEAL